TWPPSSRATTPNGPGRGSSPCTERFARSSTSPGTAISPRQRRPTRSRRSEWAGSAASACTGFRAAERGPRSGTVRDRAAMMDPSTDPGTAPDAPQGPLRVIPAAGEPEPDLSALGLKDEELRELYRLMALTRRADLEATALQRQGELAV